MGQGLRSENGESGNAIFLEISLAFRVSARAIEASVSKASGSTHSFTQGIDRHSAERVEVSATT